MKVSELIDKLRTMPQDTEVVIRASWCSGSFDGSCGINVNYVDPDPEISYIAYGRGHIYDDRVVL